MASLNNIRQKLFGYKESYPVMAVLLQDVLVMSLLTLILLMTLEGLMPGFVTGRFNLSKGVFGLGLLILAYGALAAHLPPFQQKNWHKPAAVLLILWAILMFINSLLKFSWPAIIIFIIFTLLILWILRGLLLSQEKQ